MSVSPTAVNATPNSGIVIRDSHLLPCQAVFRTRDLDLIGRRGRKCGWPGPPRTICPRLPYALRRTTFAHASSRQRWAFWRLVVAVANRFVLNVALWPFSDFRRGPS